MFLSFVIMYRSDMPTGAKLLTIVPTNGDNRVLRFKYPGLNYISVAGLPFSIRALVPMDPVTYELVEFLRDGDYYVVTVRPLPF